MHKHFLTLFALAALALPAGAQTDPLPYRDSLKTQLAEGFTLQVPAGDTLPVWETRPYGYYADGAFSVEFASLSATPAATLNLFATNTDGRGTQLSLPLAPEAATYRLAATTTHAYLYRGDSLLQSLPLQLLAAPAAPGIWSQRDLEGSGIYDERNLVENPGFETEGVVLVDDGDTYKFWPAGWDLLNANPIEEQAMGVRCNRGDTLYANGREGNSALMFRQDGAGGFSASSGSAVYSALRQPLEGGRRYQVEFQALSHTNDLGKTYSVVVGTEPGQWDLLQEQWTAPSVRQTLATYSFDFTVPDSLAGEAYIGFLCTGGSGIVHLDRVCLVEMEGDYNTLTLQAIAPGESEAAVAGGAVSFDTEAFSPLRRATNQLYDGGEYRIYHTAYARLLGQKDDASTPGISAEGTNDSLTYVFVAEATSDGYYRLRQKSSGAYLASSGTYSTTFTGSPDDVGNRALWTIGEGYDGWLCNRNNGLYLGCDEGNDESTYISVFTDKSLGTYSTWQLTEAEFPLDEARDALYRLGLAELIEEATSLLDDPAYPDDELKDALQAAVAEAQAAYDTATLDDEAVLSSALETLQTAIDEFRSANEEELSFTSMAFPTGETFTLALNEVQLTSDDAAAGMVVRNALGRETRFTFTAKALLVDGDSAATFDNLTQDFYGDAWRFVFTSEDVTVYAGEQLVASVALELSGTSSSSSSGEAGWTLVGKDYYAAVMPEIVSSTEAVAPGGVIYNKYGRAERYVYFARGQNATLDTPVDLHIEREDSPIESGSFNITDGDAWIIFDNTLPSEVISSTLGFITIDGEQAVKNENCRVAIYLNGGVLIPHGDSYEPFEAYTGQLYGGDAMTYGLGKHNLESDANSCRSFILRRGYMACLASDADGAGYSRVFVADHEDLLFPELPAALDGRISSIHIRKWNYVSKKGWCSTNSNSSIAEECLKMRATWFYTWSADRSTTEDTEYIPIKQHRYWPSWSQINALEESTHVLGINEPEHSEQHTSDKCTCGGTTGAWTACTLTPDFQESGMRIGSPSPTDMSWLYQYIGHVDDMAYRCDFVAIHAYWGTNEMANASAWYQQLKTIYETTKRPIWITEWNNGASWTTESWPDGYSAKLEQQRAAIVSILEVLDTCRYVERYSIYNWDSYYRAVINTDDGWVTPAGQVYRDNKSTFAYNADVQYIPHWWTPSVKDVELGLEADETEQTLTFTFTNPNVDLTDSLVLQYKPEDNPDEWQTLYTELDRSRYDSESFSVTLPFSEAGSGQTTYRLKVETQGETRYSSEVEYSLPLQYTDGISAITAAGLSIEEGRIVLPEGSRYSCRILTPAGIVVEQHLQAEGYISTSHLATGVYLLHIDGIGTLRFVQP